jgi:tocopherol cyclase
VSLLKLGAMGSVGWMPGLECTHGILSFDHELSGNLSLTVSVKSGNSGNATSSSSSLDISMDGGRGYTEKDFGRSFPSLWIWIQTNSFRQNPGTSLFVSLARIPTPFFGLEFPGFTAAIWHNGILIPFATWSGAAFDDIRISKEEVYIAMRSARRGRSNYRVEISVDRRNIPEVLLYAPVNFTKMEPFVWEALRATVHLRCNH